MKITIINGAGQVDYLYGLVSGLAQFQEDSIDVLDVDETQKLFLPFTNVVYYPVYKVIPHSSPLMTKIRNITRFYFLQFWYILSRKPRLIHFQWLDRYIFIDRIILPGLARLRGHKVVFTVHNINAAKRDNRDNWFNRFSLLFLYSLSHHLIVHTPQSKVELLEEFPINENKVSIIGHGMNNKVAQKGLTKTESRSILKIDLQEKVVLFFGNIDYYKGLDLLIDSLRFLPSGFTNEFRLVIAGSSKMAEYTNLIMDKIKSSGLQAKIISRIGYIPDEEVEKYFMAADCITLPYRNIYQSGVIFMAYTFGLPVIVSDIGNFSNDLVEGKTGYLLSNNTPEELSKAMVKYFNSPIYKNLNESREQIKKWAWKNYSWNTIGSETRRIYKSIH